MPLFSNVDDVEKWLKGVVDGLNFTIPGRQSTLGNDAATAVAEGIIERSELEQRGAINWQWPENSPKYKARKKRLYGTDKTNFRTGQMISEQSLLARVVVEPNVVTMWYGTGKPPTQSYTGYMEEDDDRVTDQEKAEFAHAQSREFFEIDDKIETELVLPIVGEAIAKYIQEKANG